MTRVLSPYIYLQHINWNKKGILIVRTANLVMDAALHCHCYISGKDNEGITFFFYRSFRQVHSKWLQWHASALLPPKCPLQGLCPSEWVGHKNAYFWLEFAHYTRSNQKKKNWFMLFIGIYHVEFRMPQINNNQPKGSPPKPTNRNTHSHFNFNVTSFSIISVAEVEALRAIHPVRVPLNW